MFAYKILPSNNIIRIIYLYKTNLTFTIHKLSNESHIPVGLFLFVAYGILTKINSYQYIIIPYYLAVYIIITTFHKKVILVV